MLPLFWQIAPGVCIGTGLLSYGLRLVKQLAITITFVLALRIPFLNQAIQGDNVNYLYGAEHAQIDPLHPSHARYAFQGRIVDMRGHPHPPLNAWILAGLLALFRDVREVPFHAVYMSFSLIAAVSALALARRFSPHPLAATLLFLVTPTFVINGNSLEADVPFVAFWLASIALYVRAVDRQSIVWLGLACVAMALAAMAAYQAVVLVPILWFYGRRWKPAWAAALAAPITIAVWQVFERSTSGAMPASVLAGYMQSYGLQTLRAEAPECRGADRTFGMGFVSGHSSRCILSNRTADASRLGCADRGCSVHRCKPAVLGLRFDRPSHYSLGDPRTAAIS